MPGDYELIPVLALISSVLFRGDHMAPKLVVGGLLAIIGVAITHGLDRAPGQTVSLGTASPEAENRL